MTKLLIRRKFSIKYLFRVSFKVFVDGKLLGSIYPSEELECELNEK